MKYAVVLSLLFFWWLMEIVSALTCSQCTRDKRIVTVLDMITLMLLGHLTAGSLSSSKTGLILDPHWGGGMVRATQEDKGILGRVELLPKSAEAAHCIFTHTHTVAQLGSVSPFTHFLLELFKSCQIKRDVRSADVRSARLPRGPRRGFKFTSDPGFR